MTGRHGVPQDTTERWRSHLFHWRLLHSRVRMFQLIHMCLTFGELSSFVCFGELLSDLLRYAEGGMSALRGIHRAPLALTYWGHRLSPLLRRPPLGRLR